MVNKEQIKKALEICQLALSNCKTIRIDKADFANQIICQALDDLKLYKKAFEQSCKDKAFSDIDQHSTQDFMDMYLNHARKEIENEKAQTNADS